MKFARHTEHTNIKMRLIGQWADLAAYYEGSDGNVWTFHVSGRSWANEGPIEEFRRTFTKRRRGELFWREGDMNERMKEYGPDYFKKLPMYKTARLMQTGQYVGLLSYSEETRTFLCAFSDGTKAHYNHRELDSFVL